MNEIAKRYGNSLFSLANDENNLDLIYEQIKEIGEVINANPDFITLINSDFLSVEERKEIVDKTFVGVHDYIISLIKILIENSRAYLLNDCFDAFISYANEAKHILEGLLYSTEPISKELKEEIEKKISIKENNDVYLINKIDSALIGGIKVVINGHIYDGSIKNKIENMKTSLLSKEELL